MPAKPEEKVGKIVTAGWQLPLLTVGSRHAGLALAVRAPALVVHSYVRLVRIACIKVQSSPTTSHVWPYAPFPFPFVYSGAVSSIPVVAPFKIEPW